MAPVKEVLKKQAAKSKPASRKKPEVLDIASENSRTGWWSKKKSKEIKIT